jgi:hypothetical protein
MRYLITSLFLLGLTLNLSATPTTINYQGQLQDASGPVTDTHEMTFRLFDSESGAGQIGSELSFAAVSVENGLFQVDLDFGEEAFSQGNAWLEIEVESNILTPRQRVTAVPFALHALNAQSDGGDDSPWITSGDDIHFSQGNVGIGMSEPSRRLQVIGNSLFLGDVEVAENLAVGVTHSDLTSYILFRNASPSSGPRLAYIAPAQVFQLQDASTFWVDMDARVDGALDVFGPVRVGSASNEAGGTDSFVSGGTNNNPNMAEGNQSFVGGGTNNQAIGDRSFVAGGAGNVADGLNAFVAGTSSEAGARGTFAAGRQAEALHQGSFVWSAWQVLDDPFQSTGNNQFLVRASGGVGINKNDPQSALDVAGTVRTDTGVQFPTGSLMTANPVTGGYIPELPLLSSVDFPLSHDGELRVHCKLSSADIPGFVELEFLDVGSSGGSYFLRGTNENTFADDYGGSPPSIFINSGLALGDFTLSVGLNGGRLITVRGAVALPVDGPTGNCRGIHVDIADVVAP